jgi:hypothetical protein
MASYKHYSHSPFTFEWEGTKANVNEDGVVKKCYEGIETLILAGFS